MAAAPSSLGTGTMYYKRPMPKILVKNMPTQINIFGERVKFNQTTLKGGGRRKNKDIFNSTEDAALTEEKPFEHALLSDDFDRLYLGWMEREEATQTAKRGTKDDRKKNIRYLFRAVFGSKVIDKDTNKLYNRFEWFYIKMKTKGKSGSIDPKDKLPCPGSTLYEDFRDTLLFRMSSLFLEAKSAKQVFGTPNEFTAQKEKQYMNLLALYTRMESNPRCFDYYNDTANLTEDEARLMEPEMQQDVALLRRIICNIKTSGIQESVKRETINELKRLSGIVFDEDTCPTHIPGVILAPPMRGGGSGPAPGPDTALLILSLATEGITFKPFLAKTRSAIDDIGSCKLTMEALRTLLTSMDAVPASLMPREGEGEVSSVGLRLESIDAGPLAAIEEALKSRFSPADLAVLKSMAIPLFIVPGADGVPYATTSEGEGVSVGALLFMFLVALCDCSGADIDGSPGQAKTTV